MTRLRVLVVGCGVIGVCCGLALRRSGFDVTIADPEPPGMMTSSGNAGGFGVTEVMPIAIPGVLWRAPGWLLDPLGPLALRWRYLPRLVPWLWRFQRASQHARVEHASHALASILRHTYDDTKPLLAAAGIADLLVEKGALTVYRSERAFLNDSHEWSIKRDRGIRYEVIDAQAIRELEPALDHSFCRGVFTPEWSHVRDPHRVVTAVAALYEKEGGELLRKRVQDFENLRGERPIAIVGDGERIGFERLVVAAGVWSKGLAARLGSHVPLESERGYNTTLPDPRIHLEREVIFAERKFVVTPMAMGLRVGGAVELAGLEAPPNYARSRALLELAMKYLPGLNGAGGRPWMGHRPALPDSLPIIGRSPHHPNVFFAFGHGHLGLTMAATTGRLVSALVTGSDPGIDLWPFRVDRF